MILCFPGLAGLEVGGVGIWRSVVLEFGGHCLVVYLFWLFAAYKGRSFQIYSSFLKYVNMHPTKSVHLR